jgi:hypothetical protein
MLPACAAPWRPVCISTFAYNVFHRRRSGPARRREQSRKRLSWRPTARRSSSRCAQSRWKSGRCCTCRSAPAATVCHWQQQKLAADLSCHDVCEVRSVVVQARPVPSGDMGGGGRGPAPQPPLTMPQSPHLNTRSRAAARGL